MKKLISKCLWKIAPSSMELRSLKINHKNSLKEAKQFESYLLEDWINFDKALYKKVCGRELDLETPERFSEKIQWRKMFDANPVYSDLTDKYAVRKWVASKIGEEHLIPLLGVWDDPDDIRFDELPKQFVLKTNNASGTNIIVTDKNTMNRAIVKEKLRYWMAMPFYIHSGELHYRAINPKIIAEQYMKPEDGQADIKDYKFLCFDGQPHYCWVDINRYHGHKRKIYDLQWCPMPWEYGPYGFYDEPIEKPETLKEMIECAQILASGFAHTRVDFYSIEGKVYFSEMTFTSASGFEQFTPDEIEYEIGKLWDINKEQVDLDKVRYSCSEFKYNFPNQ